MNTSATSDNLKMHRSFSFETEEYRESSITVKEQEEKEFLETMTPINLGFGQDIDQRSTRFHEGKDLQRPVARTFAEILGEPFVPTAYSKGD